MISIVDYGVGNLQSLKNAFSFLNIRSKLIRTPAEIVDAEKLVLPGVGAFAYAMQNIQELREKQLLNQSEQEWVREKQEEKKQEKLQKQ